MTFIEHDFSKYKNQIHSFLGANDLAWTTDGGIIEINGNELSEIHKLKKFLLCL